MLNQKHLLAQALTAEKFAVFGDVIDVNSAENSFEINHGFTTRFHDLAHIDVADRGGRAGFSIFHAKPALLPHKVKVMEYHPFGSQLFYPLQKVPFFVLVAPPSEHLEIDRLELFVTNGEQGVNYHKGVWHHYLLPMGKMSQFVVLDRIADDNNCIEVEVEEQLVIGWNS